MQTAYDKKPRHSNYKVDNVRQAHSAAKKEASSDLSYNTNPISHTTWTMASYIKLLSGADSVEIFQQGFSN